MVKVKRNVQPFSISPDNEKTQLSLNIFNVLKRETVLSIGDIGKKADVPDGAVAEYINTCVKNDLLKISGAGEGEPVKFNEDFKKILGVGFSDEECVVIIMDLGGNVISKEHIKIDPLSGLKGRNKEVKEITERIKSKTNLKGTKFHCAGVAVPEILSELNPKSVVILAEGVSHIFGCDVFIAREVTAAGYGEKDSGDRAGGKDVLYMHADVGSGVIIKNEMIFEPGAVESGESAYLRPWKQFSIVKTAKSLVNKGLGTDIVDMVDGNIDNITLDVVLNAAGNHDELAEDLVKRSALALGVRVAYLTNMFNTGIVVLGGGTEKKEGDFTQFVNESAKRFFLKDLAGKVNIVSGVLGKEASSIGAASLCRRELFMEV